VIFQRLISHMKEQESIMSARNGDKSRYHRERKQKIARRKRTQELLSHAGRHGKSGEAPSGGKALKVTE
jgi:hypothetical protein